MDKQDETTLLNLLVTQIKAMRVARNMSQHDLSIAIGKARTTIVNFEQGNQWLPIHVLYDITEVFGISIHDLLPPRLSGVRSFERELLESKIADLQVRLHDLNGKED